MTKTIPLFKKLTNQEEDKQEHCDSAWKAHESILGRLLLERKDADLRLGVQKHLLQEMLHIWEPSNKIQHSWAFRTTSDTQWKLFE